MSALPSERCLDFYFIDASRRVRLLISFLHSTCWLHAVPSMCPGSGKTHSMLGEVEENSEKNGIIPRAVDHIFSFIRSQHADAPIDDEEAALNAKIVSNTLGEVQFLISLSFLEIYKSDKQHTANTTLRPTDHCE